MALETSLAASPFRPPLVLSKWNFLSRRQCPKGPSLKIHQSELEVTLTAMVASFKAGHQVIEVARRLIDPKGTDVLTEPKTDAAAAAQTQAASVEAIAPETAPQPRERIRQERIACCGLNTLALSRLWELLSGSPRTAL